MGIYTRSERPVVGLIPAAGQATRLGQIACSKEVLPVAGTAGESRPVGQYLIEQMARAGASQLYFILRDGKWDIPATFGHGAQFNLHIAYLLMNEPWGPPFTLNQATPFVSGATVLMGFPDILVAPNDAFSQALARLDESGANVVLGTFVAQAKDGCDQVEVDASGRVLKVIPKEKRPVWSANSKAWVFAVWDPVFTAFLHDTVVELGGQAASGGSPPEWPVGVVLGAAIDAGLHIHEVHFSQGRFLDIGEPQRLAQAGHFADADRNPKDPTE